MALFHYQASDIHGRKRSGILEADSARHARQLLREQALIPVRLDEKQVHHKHSLRSILRFRPRRGEQRRTRVTDTAVSHTSGRISAA